MHNLAIDGTGVELRLTSGMRTPLVALYNCSEVALRGLTVDCDPVAFLQGTIAAVAADRTWYDLQVDPGYNLDPVADKLPPRPLSIIDKRRPELSWKHHVPDLYLTGVEWVAGQPRRLRAFTAAHCRGAYPVAAGDRAVLPFFGAPGFTCRGSVNIRFEDCTIGQAGSIAFHEHGGDGNTVLRRCQVRRRPNSGRLLSTNADGCHSKNMRRGPTIEDCLFEGMHDDGVNIHGMFGAVAGAVEQSTRLQVVPYFEDPGKPGDTIEFFSARTGASLGCRTLRKATPAGNADRERARTCHRGAGYGLLLAYELDAPVTPRDGDARMNLNLCGRGFTVRNCELRAFRYCGLLLRSLDGVVEGNRLHDLGNDGLVLQADLLSEGSYARDIQVRANTIERVGLIPFMNSGCGIAVWTNGESPSLDTRPLRLNRDLVIEGNTITDVTRDGTCLRGAAGVTLRGNTVCGVGLRQVYTTTAPQAEESAEVNDLRPEGRGLRRVAAAGASGATARSQQDPLPWGRGPCCLPAGRAEGGLRRDRSPEAGARRACLVQCSQVGTTRSMLCRPGSRGFSVASQRYHLACPSTKP